MSQATAALTPAVARSAPAAVDRWLALLALTLLGYALCGKGWAYIGVPPLFIGDAILLAGVAWLLHSGHWQTVLAVRAFWLLLLLDACVLVRLAADFPVHGIAALRDAAICGYSGFALVVFACLLDRPARLLSLLRWYRWFAVIFPLATPVLWFGFRWFGMSLPRWPWVDVPVFVPKGGDVMVHSAGILAFWVVGLDGVVGRWRLLLLAACAGIVGMYDRAGLLSFLAVFGLCFVIAPLDRALWHLVAVGLCGLVFLVAADVRIKIPNREREISIDQVLANLASITGTTKAGDLDDTKEWRLSWWGDIVDYTVHGKYFWEGKGFGINLADDDGYQVEEDASLRSPHNGHFTMLARTGVPGFVLWVLVQLGWGCALAGGYLHSHRAGRRGWAALFFFLLAYAVAFMINTTFDVFIEGPMGGIWYWTLFGVGLAALWLYRHEPEALS